MAAISYENRSKLEKEGIGIDTNDLLKLNSTQWSDRFFDESKLTLVTALFDLNRHEDRGKARSIDDYLNIGKHLLNLPFKMVIVTETNLAPLIWNYRMKSGLADKTYIWTLDLEQSPYYRHLPTIQSAFQSGRKPIGTSMADTPHYLVMGWTRYWILKRVTQLNPFDSEGLIWWDYGIFHLSANQVSSMADTIMKVMSHSPCDKIKLMLLEETGEDEIKDRVQYYSRRRCKLAAGFCSASLTDFEWLADSFDSELINCLQFGYPALEETILSVVYSENRHRFNPYYGDYHQIAVNNITMSSNIDIVIRNINHCRIHNLAKSIINIIRYILQGVEAESISLLPIHRIKIMDELLIATWWLGYKDYSRLAALDIVDTWPTVTSQNRERLFAHYSSNLSFHGIDLPQ